MTVYCTTYCNKGHRVSDGKPVNHECRVIPPESLAAEIAGDYSKSVEILRNTPAVMMVRGVKS